MLALALSRHKNNPNGSAIRPIWPADAVPCVPLQLPPPSPSGVGDAATSAITTTVGEGADVGVTVGVTVGVGTGVGVGVRVGAGVGVAIIAVGVGCGVGVSGTGIGVGGVVVRDTLEAHAEKTNNNTTTAKTALVNFIVSDSHPQQNQGVRRKISSLIQA